MIAVIDYGIGNLESIKNMFKKVGYQDVVITNEVDKINAADKLILPGVGAFDYGMENINSSGLKEVLNRIVIDDKKPILGICLGMQLLTRGSEEGNKEGLGWIDADTVKIDAKNNSLKVPHMGWNYVNAKKEHPLLKDLPEKSRFYFVHSFHVKCDREEDTLLTVEYGDSLCCGVQKENIIGVQFHPEKSHKYGMKLFENFLNI